MKLPSDIPASFFVKRHKRLASISYRLTARLVNNSDIKKSMKFKKIIVIKPVPDIGKSEVQKKVVGRITSCGCCEKGEARLTATFEKDSYAPGEVARVKVALDNTSCRTDCSNITLTLMHNVIIRGGEKEQRHDTFDIVTSKIPGVRAGAKTADKFTEVQLPSADKDNNWEYADGNPKEHIKGLSEDYGLKTLANTVKSEYITSEYFLKVTGNMSGLWTDPQGHPEVMIPLHINVNEPTVMPLPQPPSEWGPQQMQLMSYMVIEEYYKGGNPKYRAKKQVRKARNDEDSEEEGSNEVTVDAKRSHQQVGGGMVQQQMPSVGQQRQQANQV